MKIKIITYLLLFVCFYSYSQTNFNKGIYTSWETLRANTPDHALQSEVVYKKVTTDQQKAEPHRIAVIKNDAKQSILAFSDGKELFFNEQKPDLKNKPFFNHVTMYGDRYGVYSSLFVIGINKNLGVGNFPMHCNVKGLELIDFKNGNVTKILNKGDLKNLLQNDQELLKRFKKEANKHRKIRVYLLEYLIRNS